MFSLKIFGNSGPIIAAFYGGLGLVKEIITLQLEQYRKRGASPWLPTPHFSSLTCKSVSPNQPARAVKCWSISAHSSSRHVPVEGPFSMSNMMNQRGMTWRLTHLHGTSILRLLLKRGDLIVHKRASDSFYDTSLQYELDKHGIANLVVVGGQTEYCVETTVRRATTLGYNVTLVGDAHTTEDYDEAVLSAAQRIAYRNEVLNGFRTDTYTIHVKSTSEIRF
jgi:nicotinamidase-related amidase